MRITLSDRPDLAPWQYRIAPLSQTESEGLYLELGPDLPTMTVETPSGRTLGFLIGFPIDLTAGRMVEEKYEFRSKTSNRDHNKIAEEILGGLGGNFLLLYNDAGVTRLYPDGVSHIPCVFDSEQKLAGSTAHALLNEDEYHARFLKASYVSMEIDNEGWFPAGLTSHRGIFRLLPNHFLDLTSWKSVRFWPLSEIEETSNVEEVADRIADIVRIQINALVSSERTVAQGLTGGFETRWLLACARPFVGKIEFVTVEQDRAGHIDTHIASQLSKEFELMHRVLKRRKASKAERDTYIRQGGHCVAGGNSQTHPCMWPLTNTYRFIGGLDGEIARGYTWARGDTPNDNFDASVLAGRLGLPRIKAVLEPLEVWLDELPVTNFLQVLDISYVENRMGPWAHAQFCCDPSIVRFNPIGTPETVRLMLSLPPDWKREYRLASHVIERNWPELMKVPINSRGRIVDLVDKILLALNDPSRVVRKFRKFIR